MPGFVAEFPRLVEGIDHVLREVMAPAPLGQTSAGDPVPQEIDEILLVALVRQKVAGLVVIEQDRRLGHSEAVIDARWPVQDESALVQDTLQLVIQVNGKLKGAVTVPAGSGQDTVMAAAMELDKVRKAAEGMTVVKTILVKDKLMNLIVKPAK